MLAAMEGAEPAIVLAAFGSRLRGWDMDPFAVWPNLDSQRRRDFAKPLIFRCVDRHSAGILRNVVLRLGV